ncbi:MAG: NTP transferase domain-containing protein [Acidobacteria bacterium]|jgi:bifunctional UDP-N-acetylglucosamine pyrophosphorylase/glucosamine-1-phosphate N-acetyltransferase|nr:NTP transferase domain-containing protein [Acidobacteriota bacterium]
MADKIKAVVLAAGKSTRMKSELSKVLHPILGREIIRYLLDSLRGCGLEPEDIVVVVGDNRAEVEKAIGGSYLFARQQEPLGTAHALLSAAAHVAGHEGGLLVLVGDNPYITAGELGKLIAGHQRSAAACTFISAVFSGDIPPFGRVVRDGRGKVQRIVEERDASAKERLIREVNASIYLFDNPRVFPLLAKIGNDNAKKEYYLTDIIALLRRENLDVEAVVADDRDIAIGINDRRDLQEAQRKFNLRAQQRLLLESGVTILQPETVTIEHDVEIGRDTVIYPGTYLAAGTRIGRNCVIGPFAYLKNVRVADGEKLEFVKKQG